MKSLGSGKLARVKMFLSLALLVVSVSACHAQNGMMGLVNGQPAVATSTTSINTSQTSYADLVSRVSPAVVTIRSTERARQAQQFPFMDDPSLREFFGNRAPQQQAPERVQGVGSGVIVNSDG